MCYFSFLSETSLDPDSNKKPMMTPLSSGYLNQKNRTVSDFHGAANGVRFLNTLSLINNHLSWITIVFAKCIYLGDARIRSEPNISESSDAAGVNYSEKLHSAHVEKWSIHCEQKNLEACWLSPSSLYISSKLCFPPQAAFQSRAYRCFIKTQSSST